MYNVKHIISDHFQTFYNYRTNQLYRIWPRYVLISAISVLLAIFFGNGGKEFLDGVITAQAVLIGFSFNVVFYFASRERPPKAEQTEDVSIEAGLRSERLNKLEKEIFYNVLYYNLVAISCILSALILMMSLTSQGIIAYLNVYVQPYVGNIFINIMYYFKYFSLKAIQIAFYLALIEGGYTFIRTVIRIGYLFDRRLKSVHSAEM